MPKIGAKTIVATIPTTEDTATTTTTTTTTTISTATTKTISTKTKRETVRNATILSKSRIRQKTEQYWESICQKLFNNQYVQTVSYFPLAKQKLCVFALCLAMLLLTYWLFVQKSYLELSNKRDQQQKLQTEITQLRNNLASLPDIEHLDRQHKQLHQQIILDVQDKWQAIMILALNESGAQLIDWSPESSQDRLKINGSFEQLSKFLTLITERLINKKIDELVFEVKSPEATVQVPFLELALVLSEVNSD